MTVQVSLVLELVKLARDVQAKDVLILLDGIIVKGTPITRDEYASHVMNSPIQLGTEKDTDANWVFLKNIIIGQHTPLEIKYLAVDTNKVSAINIMESRQT